MAKPVRFTPKKSPHGWRINIPAKFSETGKRQQLFYRTQALALTAADDLKAKREQFGNQTRAISPSLAEQAIAAANRLEPWGVSILEAANIVAEMRERGAASRPLNAAADDWLLSCDELRPRTLQGYRQTLTRLRNAHGAAILSTLTTEDLQAALAPPGTPGTTARVNIRQGKVFWNWAANKGWCDEAVAKKLEAPKARNSAEIEILLPEAAEALLRTAERLFPHAVATYAVQFFGGVRVEESTRLGKDDVSPEGIELSADITKKGRRRHITPNTTLESWLAEYPFAACPNWKRVDTACRRAAGWDVVAPLLDEMKRTGKIEEIPPVSRGAWPQNGIRHSHASYAVAAGTPLETLLFEFGHTGSPAVMREHYVGRVSKKQAVAYWSIGPKGKKLSTIQAA